MMSDWLVESPNASLRELAGKLAEITELIPPPPSSLSIVTVELGPEHRHAVIAPEQVSVSFNPAF
jgi:hypothetical protein